MNLVEAIILSVVEGITEFLPVSSTAHLVLTSNLLQIPQTDFVKTFEISIQLGAILAVVWLYRKQILDTSAWKLIMSAFVPTAILGFGFYGYIKDTLIGNIEVTLAALFVGGIVLLFVDRIKYKKTKLTLARAAGIGLFQALSMIPGVSRAAATIIGGRFMGLSTEEAVKFSFLLAIPTMVSATGLDLVKSGLAISGSEWIILIVGFVGAFLTAMVAVKGFVTYIQKNSLRSFGIYRIILAVVYLVLWL